VLLCLFDGIPIVVHIEEPRQGVQYGVDRVGGDRQVHLRNIIDTDYLDEHTGSTAPSRIHVPTRNGYPGVIAVRHLGDRMKAIHDTMISTASTLGLTTANFAMEMLQFPFRQVFGPVGEGLAPTEEPDGFRPTIALDEVRGWEEGS
jgi:hypothetical protein